MHVGFKLWEGAQDLVSLLVSSVDGPWQCPLGASSPCDAASDIDGLLPRSLVNKQVLELGCGHGLPGIMCLLAGAKVTFHVRNISLKVDHRVHIHSHGHI